MGFRERMDSIINQGLSASREALDKAKVKARELGEKGVLKWEISQLERDAQQVLTRLGSAVYRQLIEQGRPAVEKTDPVVERILLEVQDLERRIADKEAELKSIGEEIRPGGA